MFGLVKDLIYSSRLMFAIYIFAVISLSWFLILANRLDLLELFMENASLFACVIVLPALYGRNYKWYSYEVILPVKKGQIVGVKYIAYFIIISISFLLSLFLTVLTLRSAEEIFALFRTQVVYGGMIFIFGAIYLLLAHLLGKFSEAFMAVGFLLSVGIMALGYAVLEIVSIPQSLSQIFILGFGLALYITSYVVSLYSYQRKEF